MKIMKTVKLTVAGVWFLSVVGAAAILALLVIGLRAPSNPRTIAVRGECLTTAPRDKTAITLRVTTLDKSAAKSMKQATATVAKITDFVKTLDDAQMQTTEFNSYEKTEWNRDLQKSISLGIETTIAVEISAKSIETIESVLNEFAGADNVFSENLRMYTSAEVLKPIMEKCLGVAVENARVRANALAAGDKRRAGKMLSVSYETSATNTTMYKNIAPRMMAMGAVAESAMDVGGALVSKDTDVSVSVSAVFEVK
ncbi:MAG: SIMPL domain-containing protein [Alphaproteobacteria bacterium]|nr:SIMPL domain-containing protein [Alphaproteobacteria bacterium]